jgi:hypothetical protein
MMTYEQRHLRERKEHGTGTRSPPALRVPFMNSSLWVWRVRFWLAAAAAVLVGLHAPKPFQPVAHADSRPHVAVAAAMARVDYAFHAHGDSRTSRRACIAPLGDASVRAPQPEC